MAYIYTVPSPIEESIPMAEIFQRFVDQVFSVKGDVWDWFSRLNREEWIVVLAVVSVLGFLCMLGYGSRSKY